MSFYDISLVDGYNLPIAIQVIPITTNDLTKATAAPNETNPSCVGSVHNLAPANFDPYSNGQQTFLGTDAAQPLPFDTSISSRDVSAWCPYDLQQNPLKDTEGKPCPCFTGSDVAHPPFNPCLSACSKYTKDSYCCAGKHDTADTCGPNYYSQAAKKVCPDAYSYAYDDSSSTFAVPTGSGFEVIFCPGGRSTNIIQTLAVAKGETSTASRSQLSISALVAASAAILLVA